MWILYFFVAAFLAASTTAVTEWDKKEVDFIVVGAGAAGAAVAARLSEESKYEVALLEAGGEPPYISQIPYYSFGPLKGDVDWNFLTEKQDNAFLTFKDQKVEWPRGKGLGGTTIINAMFLTRGSRHDYDHWAKLGNDGWDYESVLPYFRKLEDYRVPIQDGSEEYHSQNGPFPFEVPPYRTPLADAFLEAGKELGYSIVDYNAKNMTGVANPVFNIRNGTKWTTNDAYIKPARKRPNFHVITDAFVTKVLFDGAKHAIGVNFIKFGTDFQLKAKREVILSAGAVNTPHILMLSGIGPKKTLDKFKIPVVADLPGVGQNLQDHVCFSSLTFSVDKNVGFKPEGETTPETLEQWETHRQGPLTVPFRAEGIAFVNTKYVDAKEDHPDIEIVMTQPPNGPFPMAENISAQFQPECGKGMITLLAILLRPKSRGYITLQSADPKVPAIFQPNYLSHPDDAKVLVDGVYKAINLVNLSNAFNKYNVKLTNRKLIGCERLKGDDYWECAIRHYPMNVHHQSGTCKMGQRLDPMAVVDPKLKVHAVSNLRVVDTSISPTIITGHTMVPAIMIGEKAADMIKKQWKEQDD